MSAATDAALKAVEAFTFSLRHDSFSGALTAIDNLEEMLHALRAELQEKYRLQMEAAIAAASGSSTTHRWVVTESGINCLRCHLTTVSHVVRLGALPECEPGGCDHLVVMNADVAGSHRCTYCKSVFPATADVRAGVSS